MDGLSMMQLNVSLTLVTSLMNIKGILPDVE